MINKNDSTRSEDPEIIDIDNNVDGNNGESNANCTNLKIITWNLWCMIFAPRTLSNPQRCGKYMLNLAKQQDWSSYNGLIICGFQEIWSWKVGLFPPCLLRLIAYFEYIPYFGVLISFIFQFLSLLFGVLPIFKCLPIYYNPKKQIASKLLPYLPYSYWNNNIPWRHFLDNGLLFLSNQKPDECGYGGYVNHKCNDSLAYKGFLYLYYKQYNILAINTHLQSAGDGKERLKQVDEIKEFIEKFTKENAIQNELKIIACGDFNVDMTNHDKILKKKKEKQEKQKKHVPLASIDEINVDTKNNKDINIEIQNELEQMSAPKLLRRRSSIIFRSLSYQDLPMLFGTKFFKVNGCLPTLKDEKWGCLDHIFVNFKINKLKEQIHGRNKKLSDHLMIVNDIECNQKIQNEVNEC